MTESTDPLAGTSWQVEDILAGGVIDRSRVTVEFFEPGRVAGHASCNRYRGSYESDGDSLSFGPLAGTMKACPEALMKQEQRFHQAMSQVTAWRIDPARDMLHLLDTAGDTLIRAARMRESSSGEN